MVAIGAGTAAASGGMDVTSLFKNPDTDDADEENKKDYPYLSLTSAILTVIISVVLVAFNTQIATDSIQALLQRRKVSQTFLSLVILPLLSIDPMAINMAIKDKMDMSIALTLEICIQMCLLLIVLLAWCMGVDGMDPQFDGFTIATLVASIIIVAYVVQDGKSNRYFNASVVRHEMIVVLIQACRLTGTLLIEIFIIIALAAFHIQ